MPLTLRQSGFFLADVETQFRQRLIWHSPAPNATTTAMKTVHAVYEQGVFKPTGRVDLPDHCQVEFEPRPVGPSAANGAALADVYAVLSERYESGESDVAARHDEHQP